MSELKNSIGFFPKVLKGAIVALNPVSGAFIQTIYFQFNPENVSRSLQAQASTREGGDRREALRLKGAPIETLKLDAEFDSTGPLSSQEQDTAISVGIYAQLSALETLIYPESRHIEQTMNQAAQGILEIAPPEAPLTLLVWGERRVLPVRLTDFSITEEAYDVALNPIRAKVSLSLRVLNYDDLPWQEKGSQLFLAHHKAKEALTRRGSIQYDATRTGAKF